MDPIFRNILLPVDGSAQSLIAQNMTMFLSKKFGSEVTVMHVVPNEPVSLPEKNYVVRENYAPISTATGQFPRALTPAPIKEYAMPEEVATELREGYLTEGQALLSEVAKRFIHENIVAHERLVEGTDAADLIISEAEHGKYDLITMGNSEGEKNQLDFHLGSVAERVSSKAKIPILIVRQKTEISNIVVPIEGSQTDHIVLREAGSIASTVGAKVILLFVQETSILRFKPDAKEIGLQVLKDAAAKMGGLEVEQKLVTGDLARETLRIADQEGDLIVMAAGPSSLHDFFLGSVHSHVLHYARVPVLLAK